MPADPDDEMRRPALWEAGRLGSRRTDRRWGAAGATARRVPHPHAAELGDVGADRGRLPDDRDDARATSDGADPGRPVVRGAHQRKPGTHSRRREGEVAGMVVARQRPATANGVVFMLLEDERGTINLIVPPPVVERRRLAVRTSGFVLAAGKLEHREGTTNVVVYGSSACGPMSCRRRGSGSWNRRCTGRPGGPGARTDHGRPVGGRPLQARLRRRP